MGEASLSQTNTKMVMDCDMTIYKLMDIIEGREKTGKRSTQ